MRRGDSQNDVRAEAFTESYERVSGRVEATIRAETDGLVADSRAVVTVEDPAEQEGYRVFTVAPANKNACPFDVIVQSDREVSFCPEPPDSGWPPVVDVYSSDPDELIDAVREYLRAIVAGRFSMVRRRGREATRCMFRLADGTTQTHDYNLLFGVKVGRWGQWDEFQPEPY